MSSSRIKVGARSSPLSRAQVQEVYTEIKRSDVIFDPIWVETRGDKDLTTSLRTLDKTDFFTQEIDTLLLQAADMIMQALRARQGNDVPEFLPDRKSKHVDDARLPALTLKA